MDEASTARWFAVKLDERHAAKTGMPSTIPVPAERIQDVRSKGLSREQAIDWIEAFLRESPRHEMAENLRRYVSKARLWDEAASHLQRRLWDKARDALERIVDLDPEDAAAHFNLGAARRNLGELEEALAAYAACEKVFADEGLFFANRGRTYHALNRTDDAVQDYERALKLMPGDAFVIERLVELGALIPVFVPSGTPGPSDQLSFLRRKDFYDALRRAWNEPGRDAAYFLGVGRVHAREGHADLALEAADRATALDPESPEPALLRGAALVQLGRMDEAEQAALRHLALLPDSSQGRALLGRVQIALGRPDAARESLERSVQLDPNHLPALELLASLRPEGAAPELEAIAGRNPASWAPWAALAGVRLKARQRDEAFQAFEEARSRGAGDEVLATYLAELGKAGRLDRLVRIADELGNLPSRAEPIRWNVAIALKSVGRRDEGTDLLKGIADDPDAHPAWRQRAKAELESRNRGPSQAQ